MYVIHQSIFNINYGDLVAHISFERARGFLAHGSPLLTLRLGGKLGKM